jgi:hypothetical protein
VPNPGAAEDFLAVMNPESLVIKQGFAEPSLAQRKPAKRISLSVKVISASTAAMQPQRIWCLTAPSVCVIPGLKSANNFRRGPVVEKNAAFAAFFYLKSVN